MTNMRVLMQSYEAKAWKIAVYVFAIFLLQITASAQTAPEQQCMNAVQGKVAWN